MFLCAAILTPMLGAIAVSVPKNLPEKTRNILYAAVLMLTDILGVLAVFNDHPVTFLRITPNVCMKLSLDSFGIFFLAALLILYSAVFFYALEYMKHEGHKPMFYAFYFLSRWQVLQTWLRCIFSLSLPHLRLSPWYFMNAQKTLSLPR